MSHSQTLVSFVAVLLLAGLSQQALADDPSGSTPVMQLLQREAEKYVITLNDDPRTKLSMRKKPLLKWVNVVRSSQQGMLFVWTDQGRARVIGTIFSGFGPNGRLNITHEFQSLSTIGLTARHDDKEKWSPKESGLSLAPFKEAPKPASSGRLRLAQMRRLARQFSGQVIDRRDKQWPLRLLTQPLFRWDVDDGDVHDGAIFTLVSTAGTDPEILLILEVRDTEEGPAWHYAAARFSDLKLFLKRNDTVVWSSTKFTSTAKDPYRLFIDYSLAQDKARELLQVTSKEDG